MQCKRSRWKALVTAAVAVVGSVVSVQAAPIWGTSAMDELTGSRSSDLNGGVTATKDWANGGFDISWDVDFDDDTDLWTYTYHVTVNNKEVSHLLMEVTEVQGGILIGDDSSPIKEIKTYNPGEGGASNPLLPNSIYAAKLDFGSTDTTYTIVTDRAPVYGVFYAKDGKTGGKDVVAWADALSEADYKTNQTLTINDFIVRPNGKHGPPDPGGDPDPPTPNNPVPEPMTAGLAVVGAMGLTLATRRRR